MIAAGGTVTLEGEVVMATVALEHVSVRHDAVLLLDDVNLVVGDGEMIGVVGASGAGKTTLLRAIAGVEALASGAISIGGVDVSDAAPAERNVSMVFQTPQLIPHRDVRRNIAFPLELRHHPEDDIATRVAAETRALHIEALLARPPRDLSAGEAQLVQIARTGARTLGAAARRTARTPRRPALAAHAPRPAVVAAGLRRDDLPRDERPRRGDVAGRPVGRARWRPRGAGGRADGDLRTTGHPDGGRVHRSALDGERSGRA